MDDPTRYKCTAEEPFTKHRAAPFGGRSFHPDAIEIDSSCDCCARFHCPNCDTKFKVELPQ